jgi:hypothetical protein
MDKLEEHIRKNREDLDMYKPSPGVWNKIRKGVHGKKSQSAIWLSIAAMIIIVIGTAIIFYAKRAGWTSTGKFTAAEERLIDNNPRLKETEIYYNTKLNSLYLEASPMFTANPEIKRELTADMSQLDSICSDIKRDLKDNVANQEVVEALIQNYRIKIRLLEDMLVILKENEENPETNNDHEL